jgi:feruloyl esterase
LLLAGFAQPASCEAIKALQIPRVTVTVAELVAAGSTARGGRGASAPLPAYCRVAAALAPSPDSHIEMELWLPTDSWNGKFLAVGNGGWAGSISTDAMATALRRGYATASNDTGHQGGTAAFALGHPEKLVTSRIARCTK